MISINKEELYKLYMEWVDKVTEDLDWKSQFGPKEIVYSIANILEHNDDLVLRKPIHKFNGGYGATLCHECHVIITVGLTQDLYCHDCKEIKDKYELLASTSNSKTNKS